jgi:hypothetical protein
MTRTRPHPRRTKRPLAPMDRDLVALVLAQSTRDAVRVSRWFTRALAEAQREDRP